MESQLPKDADIIVVGGGAAGCLLAARLAESHPELEILLVESGPNKLDMESVRNPALYGLNYHPASGVVRMYTSAPSERVAGRGVPIFVGDVLGGGSSVNCMVYARGLASDYDDWSTRGWSADDLKPLLRKTETYREGESSVDEKVHGKGGPYKIGIGGGYQGYNMIKEDALKAVEAAGVPIVPHVHDLKCAHGVSESASWVDPRTGFRQDSVRVMIDPLLRTGVKNLKIVTDHAVDHVTFDKNLRANGVQVKLPSANKASSSMVKARKLVVLAAGALSTPQILERSGVGNQELLRNLKIPLISANPGVGSQYFDHQFLTYKYKSLLEPERSLDPLWSGRATVQEVAARNNGMLGWNGILADGKMRPTAQELSTFSEDFQRLYQQDYANFEKPLSIFQMPSFFFGSHEPGSGAETGQFFSMANVIAYGNSKGHIHISGQDFDDPPDFDAGFLTHFHDLEVLVWTYKKTREFARRMEYFDGIVKETHPAFAEGSNASAAFDDAVVKSAADRRKLESIVYTKEDDEAIENFIRQNVTTMWHSAGTCPMKPPESGGAVDENLDVYGVSGLKIADLSIMPSMVCANTYSTALLIGEKASTIISGELSKKGY